MHIDKSVTAAINSVTKVQENSSMANQPAAENESDFDTRREDILAFLLKEAKQLQRASQSDSLTRSLPVLRRLLNTETLTGLSLPELKRQRSIIQRKHLLHMLAKENGFEHWAACKRHLECIDNDIEPIALILRNIGYLNLWFSNYDEAYAYTIQHGGRAISVGKQAMVITDNPL